MRPNWDFECPDDREHLRVFHQTLMAGLWAAAKKPTNLYKVNLIRQEPNESPGSLLREVNGSL